MNEFYTDYAEYLKRFFGNRKIQKISVNLGTGCPNRDGTIGTGGCIYCRNDAFTPAYCLSADDVSSQIEAGKKFFARKYPEMQFLAYFQSYTGTYGKDASTLKEILLKALDTEDVAGLIIGTRPDCLPDAMVAMLAQLNRVAPVFVELGVESSHDATLEAINRGHTRAQTEDAIIRLAEAGLHVGVHLIAGLPGETEDMILETVDKICALPVESVKLHHLQVLRGTPLARMIEQEKVKIHTFTVDEYLALCVKIIERVPRRIAIERFLASSPPALVLTPKWGLKNYEFTNLLLNKLKNR